MRQVSRVCCAVMLTVLAMGGCSAKPDLGPVRDHTTGVGSGSASPREMTLPDLAPGLLLAQEVFEQPPTTMTDPGPTVAVDAATMNAFATWGHQNIGLSFEATDLASHLWDPAEGTMDELLVALNSPGLRFGGNSVDRRVFWTSSGEKAPEWAEVTLTPADFERLAKTVAKTDSAVTLALDLGHDDAARAADMAFYAHEALGEQLIAVSIGNEPNGFHLASQPQYKIRDGSWNAQQYVSEASVYVEAIHDRVPGLPIAGPGAFDAPWWRAFLQAEFANTAALSQHWYPTWSCDGHKEPRAKPTPQSMVSPWLHERAAFMIGMGAQTAASAGVPLWMEETGPTSCPGTNEASRTHAQALWTVDYSLHAAELGVTRLNHHSMLGPCKGGAPMSIVCDPDDDREDVIQGQSNYLSLLFLAQLPTDGQLGSVVVSGDERVFAYAIQTAGQLDVVIVNMNDPQEIGRSPISINVPDGLSLTAISQLNGTDLAARNASTMIPLSPAGAGLVEVNPGSATLLRFG